VGDIPLHLCDDSVFPACVPLAQGRIGPRVHHRGHVRDFAGPPCYVCVWPLCVCVICVWSVCVHIHMCMCVHTYTHVHTRTHMFANLQVVLVVMALPQKKYLP
jgi:hypothetical protein